MSTEFFNDQWRIPSNENQNKISNYSMELDGTSSLVNIDTINSSISSSAQGSVSCWVKWDGSNNTYTITFSSNTVDRQYITIQVLVDGTAYAQYKQNPGFTTGWQLQTTSSIAANVWTHIVLVQDGTFPKIYVNGEFPQQSFTNSGNKTVWWPDLNTFNASTIGGMRWNSSGTPVFNYGNGGLDQATIFDYALSQDQVKILGGYGYVFNFISNDYIECGDITILNNLNAFSTSTWINCNSVSGSPVVLAGGNSSTNRFYIQLVNSTTLRYVSGSDIKDITISNIIDGNFHHIATVQDGTSLDVYLDNFKTSFTVTGVSSNVGDSFTIGAYFTRASNFFNGELSNTTVFNTGLTVAQVQTLYNSGKPLSDMSGFTSLQGWWKLDENAIFNSTSTEWSVDNNSVPSTYKSSLDFIPNDYIDAGTGLGNSLGTYTGDATISLWFKADTTTSNDGLFSMTPFDDVVFGNLRINIYNNNLQFVSSGIGAYKYISFTDTTSWHHLVCVFKSGDITNSKIYLDGIDQTTTDVGTFPSSLSMTGLKTIIGAYHSPNQTFDGKMSNVSFFNTALSTPNVQTLYNNGTPEASISHSPLSWWKLDNTVAGIKDSAGSNDGTNNGATKYDGFVNALAGDSVGMDSSNLVVSNINGELISNPMALSPKPIAYYQLGDQSVSTGPSADYLVPNNSLSDFVFNFSSDVVNISPAIARQQKLSYSLWINTTSLTNQQYIVGNLQGSDNGTGIFINNNYLHFQIAKPGNNSASYFGSRVGNLSSYVSVNEWFHVAASWDGTDSIIYINGTPRNTWTPTSPHIIGGWSNFIIGDGAITSPSYYSGKLSNVACWDDALTDPQVATLYNNGAPGNISSLNPAGWWKLNASEIFNNTSTEWSIDNNAYPSVYQSSLDFNGSSLINCGNDSSLRITGAMTVSYWFKGQSADTSATGVGKLGNNGSRGFALGRTDGNDIYFFIAPTASSLVYARAIIALSNTQWYHLAAVYTPSTSLVIYLDGEPLTSTLTGSVPASQYNSSNNLQIGNRGDSGKYFIGEISNVAIWNTSLTGHQIKNIYNNGTPASDISSLSPVSWWKLDNTTTGLLDSGSASNNGTNSGATEYAGFVNALAGESVGMDSSNLVVSDLQQTSGYSPYALDFDGINDILDCGNANSFDTTDSFSGSCWVYLTSTKLNMFMSKQQNVSPYRGYAVFTSGLGNLRFSMADNTSGSFVLTSTSTIPNNIWTHVAFTYNGSANSTGVKLYINGYLQTVSSTGGSIAGSIVDATIPFQISGRGGTTTGAVSGRISNASMFNAELTSTQITEVYNQGVPSNLNTFSGTAPVAWWQLGSNSSYLADPNPNPPNVIGRWTCLDEIGTNNAASSNNMTNDAITDGPGYSGSGLGSSTIDIVGDAPYSTVNGLSENMDVLDRVKNVPPFYNTSSLLLNGSNSYASFTSKDFSEGTGTVSYSFWVKPNTFQGGYGYFFSGSTSTGGGIAMSEGGSSAIYYPGVLYYYNGSSTSLILDVVLTENVWQHIAIVFESNNTISTYKNGVYGTGKAYSGSLKSTWANIGTFATTTHWLNGRVDEVAIFSSALTPSQVASIYNNGEPSNISYLNPSSWWRFESTSGSGPIITPDSGVNELTLTLNSGATLSPNVPE